MTKVKLTITESKCRCGYFKKGQEFIVEDLCPPLCHELWNNIYPSVYALQNGASLDYGEGRAKVFDARCPDEGRVRIHGEVIDQLKSSMKWCSILKYLANKNTERIRKW